MTNSVTQFGDAASLRALVSTLRRQAEDTQLAAERGQRRMGEVLATAGGYEQASAAALARRWESSHGIAQGVVAAADDVAERLVSLATVLEGCRARWADLTTQARQLGLTVDGHGEWVVVVVPPGASAPGAGGPGDDAAALRACQLQQELRAVAVEADSIRRSLRERLSAEPLQGVAELGAGDGPAAWPDTGDSSLDTALHSFLAPVSGVHVLFQGGR